MKAVQRAEEALADFKKTAEETNSFKAVEPIYNQLKEKLEQAKSQDLQTYKKEICSYLASEIAVRYYYQKGRIMNILSDDPDITVAKSILLDTPRYRSILSPKK